MSNKNLSPTLNIDVVAIAYYLYRQAGCPYGDTIPGFDSWYEINILGAFELAAKRLVPKDEPETKS